MTLAHVGVGVLVAGVTASSAWQSEAILVMAPGDRAELAGYTFTLARIDEAEGPNYVARRATFEVTRGGAPVASLTPEKRFYPVEQQATSEAGIDMGPLRDLYVVLGDPVEGAAAGGGHTVRIYHNPLVMWIWGGVIIMGFAGLLSLTDRRHRVGAPTPARARLTRGACRSVEVGDGPQAAALSPARCDLRRRRHRARGRPDPRSEHPALGPDRQAGADVRAAAARRPATGRASAAPTSRATSAWSTCSRRGACRAASSTRC